MELFKVNRDVLSNDSIEQVTPEKQEYKLIGSYFRTKGLSLYCYNQFEDTVTLVIETIPTQVRLIVISNGDKDTLGYEEFEHKRCEVDSRFYYFEALNITSAIKRVDKWKVGKCSLCNLKESNPNAMKLGF